MPLGPSQQAALEQAARECVAKGLGQNHVCPSLIDEIVKALAAQRAAVLEEVADEMARHPYWSKEAEVWIKHLRQLAQEQRP